METTYAQMLTLEKDEKRLKMAFLQECSQEIMSVYQSLSSQNHQFNS